MSENNNYSFNGTGQINMDSTFGYNLYEIASLNSVRKIFEVGSWNGQGSTVCLMNGVINNDGCILYSLEADSEMYNKSTDFWNNNYTQNKLVLLNGVLHNKIADITVLNQIYNNNIPYYNEHYLPEKYLSDNSKIINIDNIEYIDFIILDGGEYSTEEDYNILITKNPKYIALDDVNVYKCHYIRQQLLNDPTWKVYKENLNERNGWSIFEKI